MDYFHEAFVTAFRLLITLDPQVLEVVLLSLRVSLLATVGGAVLGVPLGFVVGVRSFPGREAMVILLNTLMALPTVLVGLLVYALFSRRGFLGPLGLLYTPTAIIVGETILVTPLIAALTASALSVVDKRVEPTALTLGASRWQAALAVVREGSRAILAAVTAGFGRLITELGIAVMAGGNIKGGTRTMTTAIALETSKGEFAFALALGCILLIVALGVNLLLNLLRPAA